MERLATFYEIYEFSTFEGISQIKTKVNFSKLPWHCLTSLNRSSLLCCLRRSILLTATCRFVCLSIAIQTIPVEPSPILMKFSNLSRGSPLDTTIWRALRNCSWDKLEPDVPLELAPFSPPFFDIIWMESLDPMGGSVKGGGGGVCSDFGGSIGGGGKSDGIGCGTWGWGFTAIRIKKLLSISKQTCCIH